MVPYSAHEEVRHSSNIWQIFERYLLHCFVAFIKCNIKFSKGVSSAVKDFNYSRKLCNVVNIKLKLNTVLEILVFICPKKVQVQDKT